MLREALRKVSIFRSLHRRDVEMAEKVRKGGCRHCGGPLHLGVYRRKPRGSPVEIPAEYSVRMSLCCGRPGCRRRVLPPSCLFMGRKVHWRIVIMVVMALRQRGGRRMTVEKIEEVCGVPVRTVVRWTAFFRDEFPRSRSWQRVRGRVSPAVSDGALPGAVLERFLFQHDGEVGSALVACLSFLATGEREEDMQAERGRK